MRGDVVVTGLGVCTPFGARKAAFIEGLRQGRCCATKIDRFDTAGLRSQLGCLVPDEAIKGLSAKQRRLPRAYRYALVAIDEAFSDATLNLDQCAPSRVGIFFGSPCSTEHAEAFDATLLEQGPRLVSPLSFENMTGMTGAGVVSIDRGITGPALVVPGGFAAGIQALHLAGMSLRVGHLDVAIVVAGDEIDPLYYRSLSFLAQLSPRRRGDPELCRPFDAKRDGMVLGEGGAAIILERQRHATRRGAKVYAKVNATAVTHDGGGMPKGSRPALGLERAIRLTLDQADVAGSDIDYVAACANSTPLLDEAEAASLTRVFPGGGKAPAVSSVKSMIGETGAAGGLINVASCLCAIEKSFIPPTVNVTPGEHAYELDLVTGSAREGHVHLALANASSFGGTNASVLLQGPDSFCLKEQPWT